MPPCHMTVLAFEKSTCGRKEPLYLNLLLFKMGLFCLVGATAMLQLDSSFLMKSGAPAADAQARLGPSGRL